MRMVEIVPAFPVVAIIPAVEFYRDKMGMTPGYRDSGFAILKRDQIELHLWAASDTRWKARLAALSAGTLTMPADPGDVAVVSGAETFLAGTSSCRIEVEELDELYAEYKATGVLYSESTVIESTEWGTREFPALDLHRNLLTFYERVK